MNQIMTIKLNEQQRLLEESKRRLFETPIIKEWWGDIGLGVPFKLPDREIYHYTSGAAFSNILSKHRLWLTKYDYLNDRSEIDYACNLLLERLHLSQVKDKDRIEEVFINGRSEIYNNIFVLSFSYNDDSLLMWTYYGKNADGYNIEISKDFMEDLRNTEVPSEDIEEWIKSSNKTSVEILIDKGLEQNIRPSYSPKVRGQNILYKREEQIVVFDSILSEISNHEHYESSFVVDIPNYFYINYIQLLKDMIPFFKHHKYSDEQEYRVYLQIEEIKSNPMDIIKYRNYNGVLVPYIELQIKNRRYFKSVCLSPMNSSETAKQGLESIANNHRPVLGIRESDIPARNGW